MARTAARFLLQALLAMLISYWAIFLGYTVLRFFQGGTPAVLAWYEHVGARAVRSDGSAFVFPVWQPMRFVGAQFFTLVVTALAWLGFNKLRTKPSI